MSFPKYTYDLFGRKKDPMNVVFKNTSLDKIKGRLDKFDWKFKGKYKDYTWDQYTPDSPPRSKQDAQRVKGPFWIRYHIRIWKFSNQYHIASAHYEKFTLAFTHNVFNYESAKDKIEETFSGSDQWEVKPASHYLDNKNNETYHNGKATEIEEKAGKNV